MDPNSTGMSQSDGGGQMNAHNQQGQGGAPANPNFMSSVLGQLSQMGGAGAQALGGGSQQVPLLVGQSPLQQQLNALQGLTGGQGGNQNNNNQSGGGNNGSQQPQGLSQSLFFGGGGGGQNPQGQNQGYQQQMQQNQQQQQGQQNQAAQNPLAMMAQNPLLGANFGFNLQQLQQLQLAQQLMAAGLPPQLAFGQAGGGQQAFMGGGGGLGGLANNPQLAALAGNPAAGAPLGMAPQNAGNALGGAPQATPNLQGSNTGAGGAVAETVASKASASAGGSDVGDGQEWAEPFSGKGKKEPPFPLKLHQILSNPEFQECICWNPHGRSWRILKPPVFEQLVIPLYFR